MSAKISIIGQRFGKLKVVSEAPPKIYKSGRLAQSLCRCDCGKETVVLNGHLKAGDTKSCGCGQGYTTHGMWGTRIHKTWDAMIQRCENTSRSAYKYYGGRGIRVCERWHRFENFFADMRERPAGKTIDRIDNNGNYEPGNCRWATSADQHRNTGSNIVLTVHGITGCLTDLAKIFGITYGTAYFRIRSGWPPERAFTEPVHVYRKKGTPGFS